MKHVVLAGMWNWVIRCLYAEIQGISLCVPLHFHKLSVAWHKCIFLQIKQTHTHTHTHAHAHAHAHAHTHTLYKLIFFHTQSKVIFSCWHGVLVLMFHPGCISVLTVWRIILNQKHMRSHTHICIHTGYIVSLGHLVRDEKDESY